MRAVHADGATDNGPFVPIQLEGRAVNDRMQEQTRHVQRRSRPAQPDLRNFRIQAGERMPDEDLHLSDQTHLQTHEPGCPQPVLHGKELATCPEIRPG